MNQKLRCASSQWLLLWVPEKNCSRFLSVWSLGRPPLWYYVNITYLPICVLPIDKSLVLMDSEEFKSSSYQRVYQYLRRFAAGSDLNVFSFRETAKPEGTPENCLDLLLKYGIAKT
jgi:hypothetical protein